MGDLTPNRAKILVSAEALHGELASASPPLLLDVRWSLAEPDGRPRYAAGHLPRARYVDMESELTDHNRPAREGRHPLPAAADLQVSARAWGLCDGDPVVAYDEASGLAAARLWWLLRNAGVESVRVLDGGFAAWRAAGYEVTTVLPRPEPGDVHLSEGHMPVVDADGAAAYAARGRLYDVRATARYRGETEPVDPVAGHIPGARNAPAAESLQNGRFADGENLRTHFARLGIAPGSDVALYCGSGITAAQQALALEAIGVQAHIYPPSWSGWVAEQRPAATGDEPRSE
jgi:thiosulfate/3-mercaptopyruvate sulfurtransferase